MKRAILLINVLMVCLFALAQRMPIRIMSQTSVQGAEEARCLMFDRNGLMWVGTDQGIKAYDGYRFMTYRNDAFSPGILSNNQVNAMTDDKANRLWVGTRDGLTCFDCQQGTFKSYHLRGEQARSINELFTSSDGTVWVGTDRGVSRYDAEKDDFIDINMTTAVQSFAEDAKGNIYIGTWEDGIYRLDHQSGQLVAYPSLDGRNTAQSMLMDSRGRLWIGTWENGIVRLDNPANEKSPGMHKVNEDRTDFRTFRRLVEDSVSHAVWGCCIEGLTSIDIDDVSLVENHPGLSFCYDLSSDGHGNLWVLNRNQGIVHLSTKQSPFHFNYLNPAGLVLPVNRIQAVYTADDRHFWLSLQPYGLAYYDSQTGQVNYNEQIAGFAQMPNSDNIHLQTIYDMIQYADGVLWMASSRGLVILEEGNPVRLQRRNSLPFIGDGDVKTLCRLHDGTVLIGQAVGVGVAFSDTKGRLLSMTEQGRDFSDCDVHTIIESHDHRIWIATDNEGIICATGDIHQPEKMQYHQYAPAAGNYPLDDATTVYEDTQHRLWAISSSGALFLYEPKKDCFSVVNLRYHLNVSHIYAIEGDEQGRIWLSTDRGLACLALNTQGKGHPAYYSEEDGIESFRFSANGLSRFGNRLFFGSADGFFSFEPRQIDQWHPANPAPLIVSGLLIDDRPYHWLDSAMRRRITAELPYFTHSLTIPASIKKFTVEFSLLNYMNQIQSHYAYRLVGYDDGWHYVNAENRQATFQNLPPGSYRLQLRAIDSYGHKTELPYLIEVEILPPWYRTWWAYLIYIGMLAALVYGISQWYKARLKRKARLQQRVSELLHYREMMLMQQFNDQKAIEAEEQQHNSPDEQFIQRAIDCVKNHLMDSDYDREQFARDMLVSSSTLYNKLRALTGQTVTGFVCSIRLKEACRIVRQQPAINVNELSMAVGFNTPKYFTRCFKKEFGELPSEYIDRIRNENKI